MILFADGGILGSKPYAASGAYINKMSNYCKKCKYKVSEKTGPDACPFNYLYWDFIIRNEKTRSNPRMGLIYKNLDRMDNQKYTNIKSDSNHFSTNWNKMKKSELPQKYCQVCKLPFTWRKNGKVFGKKLSTVLNVVGVRLKVINKMKKI